MLVSKKDLDGILSVRAERFLPVQCKLLEPPLEVPHDAFTIGDVSTITDHIIEVYVRLILMRNKTSCSGRCISNIAISARAKNGPPS